MPVNNEKIPQIMKTLSLLFGGAVLVSATAAISPSVSAAQTLYKPFPADVMPSLSEKGNYDVGVKTIEAAYPAKVKDIAGSKEVLSKGGQVKTIKLVKGISTTNLIRKIKDLD